MKVSLKKMIESFSKLVRTFNWSHTLAYGMEKSARNLGALVGEGFIFYDGELEACFVADR